MGEVVQAEFPRFSPEEVKQIRILAHQYVENGSEADVAVANAEQRVIEARKNRLARERRHADLNRLLAEKGYKPGGNTLKTSTWVQVGGDGEGS